MNADTEHLIYMDYNATTPLAKEVVDSVLESLVGDWGNPSSSHTYGKRSKESIAKARLQVAKMLGAQSSEIVFTSGGTEANNMIIYGVPQYFKNYQDSCKVQMHGRPHIITTNVEHDSVILPIMRLRKESEIDCSIVKVRFNIFVILWVLLLKKRVLYYITLQLNFICKKNGILEWFEINITK